MASGSFSRCGRRGAGAFQQDEVPAAGLAGGAHGLIQFRDRSHAGGSDHRLASGGDLADQRRIEDQRFIQRHPVGIVRQRRIQPPVNDQR